jgi:hypothetical protein
MPREWLTEHVGHPALAQHLHAVITRCGYPRHGGNSKRCWRSPTLRRGDTLQLPIMAEATPPAAEGDAAPRTTPVANNIGADQPRYCSSLTFSIQSALFPARASAIAM